MLLRRLLGTFGLVWLLTSIACRRTTRGTESTGSPVGLGIDLEVGPGACVRWEGAGLEDLEQVVVCLVADPLRWMAGV